MNRKVLLRLACGASVFLLCVAVRVSWSDDDDVFNDREPVASQPAVKGPAPAPKAGELRQRMVELMTRRAQRMNADELTRAIEELTKTLGDQDAAAAAELQKATEQLKSVVEKFPGTPSAARASRALEGIEKPIEIRSPKRVPSLDDGFQEDEISSETRTRIVPPASKAPVRPVSKKPG